jgi:hypothetical protein
MLSSNILHAYQPYAQQQQKPYAPNRDCVNTGEVLQMTKTNKPLQSTTANYVLTPCSNWPAATEASTPNPSACNCTLSNPMPLVLLLPLPPLNS